MELVALDDTVRVCMYMQLIGSHVPPLKEFVIYYGVATISRLLKILRLFCKRAL